MGAGAGRGALQRVPGGVVMLMRAALSMSALLAAAALSACEVRSTAPLDPPSPRFEVEAATWREGFATNPRTAALVREVATGCLYSVAEGKGAAAVLLPDGTHAGCVITTETKE